MSPPQRYLVMLIYLVTYHLSAYGALSQFVQMPHLSAFFHVPYWPCFRTHVALAMFSPHATHPCLVFLFSPHATLPCLPTTCHTPMRRPNLTSRICPTAPSASECSSTTRSRLRTRGLNRSSDRKFSAARKFSEAPRVDPPPRDPPLVDRGRIDRPMRALPRPSPSAARQLPLVEARAEGGLRRPVGPRCPLGRWWVSQQCSLVSQLSHWVGATRLRRKVRWRRVRRPPQRRWPQRLQRQRQLRSVGSSKRAGHANDCH